MKPTIAVISIGEMGLGIARLLKAHDYRVVTNVSDRSDVELVEEADYVLSIVPPRDALNTAQRIQAAVVASSRISSGGKTLSFLDLNAVSPQTARQLADVFNDTTGVRFVDGVISGGVPQERVPTSEDSKGSASWHCLTLLLCGPKHVQDTELVSVLHMEHMSETIGAATAVKMCFGMTTKGFIALAIQSFTTAHRLGVLDELQEYLVQATVQGHGPEPLLAVLDNNAKPAPCTGVRGLTILDPTTSSDAELDALYAAGTSADRVARLGCVVDAFTDIHTWAALDHLIRNELDPRVKLVADHFGKVTPGDEKLDEFQVFLKLIRDGYIYVKLSGFERLYHGHEAGIDSLEPSAKAIIEAGLE
ncbi:hypothetical protein SCUP234_00195 [Seiridium cupressi]